MGTIYLSMCVGLYIQGTVCSSGAVPATPLLWKLTLTGTKPSTTWQLVIPKPFLWQQLLAGTRVVVAD